MPPVCACVCVRVLALPYQFDTTTIFCRSLLSQLLLLTYARLPLFSKSNRPSARVFLVFFFFFSSWFCEPVNVNKKNILTHTHTCSDMFFFLYMYHTWWCPSTFRSVCVSVMPIYQIIIWNNNCFPGVQAGTHITKIELLLL